MGIELNRSNLKLRKQKQSSRERAEAIVRKRESKGNRQERAEAIVGKSKRQEQKQSSERAIVRSRSSKDNIIVVAEQKQ